jgi:hypothetical protein
MHIMASVNRLDVPGNQPELWDTVKAHFDAALVKSYTVAKKNKQTGQKRMVLDLNFGFMPIDLGELSGKFFCEIEHCLSILSHICLKLIYITPECEARMYPVLSSLLSLRKSCWTGMVNSADDEDYSRTFNGIFSEFQCSREIVLKLKEIYKEFTPKEENTESGVKWWASLIFFLSWATQISLHLTFNAALTNPFVAEVRRPIQLIHDTATNRMPPFEELIRTLCGGELEHECGGCKRPITVKEFCSRAPWRPVMLPFKTGGIVSLGFRGLKISCTSCIEIVHGDLLAVPHNPMQTHDINCHYCGMYCMGRPRCKYCQSKAYCSQQCQTKDWSIHQIFCQKIQDAAAAGETGRRISKTKVDQLAMEKDVERLTRKVNRMQSVNEMIDLGADTVLGARTWNLMCEPPVITEDNKSDVISLSTFMAR